MQGYSGGGGLLAAALERKEHQFLKDATNALERAFTALPKTLDLPASLFSSFAESYRIEKGALLLSGIESGTLVHTASTGFDITTMRRLRIPVSLISMTNSEIRRKEELHDFRPYVSTREFALLDTVLFMPGYVDHAISALLLISQAPEILFRSAPPFPEDLLTALNDSSPGGASPEASLQATLDEGEELLLDLMETYGSLSTALVDCSGLMDFLRAKHPQGDPFTLFRRGITFTSSQIRMNVQNSMILELPDSKLLFFLPEVTASRSGAFMHQAMLTLRSRFGPLKEIPQLATMIRHIPEDGSQLSELYSSLL